MVKKVRLQRAIIRSTAWIFIVDWGLLSRAFCTYIGCANRKKFREMLLPGLTVMQDFVQAQTLKLFYRHLEYICTWVKSQQNLFTKGKVLGHVSSSRPPPSLTIAGRWLLGGIRSKIIYVHEIGLLYTIYLRCQLPDLIVQ